MQQKTGHVERKKREGRAALRGGVAHLGSLAGDELGDEVRERDLRGGHYALGGPLEDPHVAGTPLGRLYGVAQQAAQGSVHGRLDAEEPALNVA